MFVLVKTFMRDFHLQQAPLMLFPTHKARRLAQSTADVLARAPMSEAQRQMLLALAQTLEKPSYRLPRAAAYLRGLAGQQVHERPSDVTWLSSQSEAPLRPLLHTDIPQFHPCRRHLGS